MTEATSPPPSPAKMDPETLVLRASPVRVTRFRRGAIIAIAAVASTSIAAAAWFALKPVSLGMVVSEEERAPVAARSASDWLADAPASYGDVPRLGPPLPGDLGPPILRRQQEMAADMSAQSDTAAQAAEMEQQRLIAQERSARESGIMLQVGNAVPRNGPAAVDYEMPAPATPSPADGRTSVDPNGQPRKDAMVGRSNGEDEVNPHRLVEPVSPWTLQAGTVIAASLITGLNSDLPGLVTAQVTENVYDSVTGKTLLLPQGSRLIGRYDSMISFGQSRALVVWQRILLPDGSSIQIDNVPATDTQGYSGLSDGVDRHSWQLLKGVALSTLLGVGTELGSGSSESDLVRAIRESAQQNTARAGDQFVSRSLDIQPTLRVRPGWPVRVVVHKDIVLRPWSKHL